MKFIEKCDKYEEACFSQNMFTNWLNCKEGQNSIQDKDRPARTTIASTPEMVHILADRRVIIEDISEQLDISVSTAHKIVHDDLAF